MKEVLQYIYILLVFGSVILLLEDQGCLEGIVLIPKLIDFHTLLLVPKDVVETVLLPEIPYLRVTAIYLYLELFTLILYLRIERR